MKRVLVMVGVLVALVTSSCGDGSGVGDGGFEPAEGGVERTVLVDYRHDEFVSAFLRYYPEKVTVRPGDVVNFRQTWTGEPHSVTMGKVVDNLFEFGEIFEKYDSPEAALAGGVPQETIDTVNATFAKLPGMLGDDYEVYQPGAQPCYVPTFEDVPEFGDGNEEIYEDVECPTAGDPQPSFDGRQGLYNSGFIPPEGDDANRFQVPIAADAEPGTYMYFCNYHWISMSGSIEVVSKGTEIPSQQEVSRQARKEIDEDAELALPRVDEVKAARGDKAGDVELPTAGLEVDEDYTVIVNEFLPSKIEADVGQPVTWHFDGIDHTVSFNVPKYFPIFTVKDGGDVFWEPESYEPVGWDIPVEEPEDPGDEPPEGEEEEEPPRVVDVGKWDGSGGFHSSGALSPGDSFTVTFTKSGTYPYACVLHPQMVGTVEVG
jgi:plastocyanin